MLAPATEDIIAWSVVEAVPGATTKIIHFLYVDWHFRNQGIARDLLADQGITKDSKILYTHLSVFSEKKGKELGWIYSPFSLYK